MKTKWCHIWLILTCVLGPALFSMAFAAPASPQLEIVGAGNDGILLSRSISDFNHTLIIESTNKVDVTDLYLHIPGFIGPDGLSAAITATIDGETLTPQTPVSVAGLGDIRVTLAATLAESGDYETPIILRYGDKRVTSTISVARTRDPLGATFTDGGVASSTMKLGAPATVSFWINAAADDRTVSLLKPSIRKLTRNSNSLDFGAEYSSPVFSLDDTGELDWPLNISASTSRSFRVTLGGLLSPGTYQGTIVFSAVDKTRKELAVSFSVRRSAALATAIIAFGLLISMALRYLKQDVQPRLSQQVDVLNLLARLRRSVETRAALLKDDEQLIGVIEDRLRALLNRLRITSDPNAEGIINAIAAKLPLIPLTINTHVEILTKEPAAQATLLGELDDIYKSLKSEDSSTAEITATKTKLDALRGKVDTAKDAYGAGARRSPPPMANIDALTLTILTRIRRSEWVFNLGLLGIAVVLGLYLLWAPNATWGETGDLFVAFLWGLGLHTVTAAQQFEGLGGLAGRFDTP